MMANVYYEKDADRSLIAGRKVAVIGYGSQGHAHALNLQGLGRRRAGRPARRLVVEGQGRGGRAAGAADRPRPRPRPTSIMILLPDTEQRDVYEQTIAPNLSDGDAVFFAHGFNIRFGADRAARRASTWPWSPPRAPATSCAAPTPRAAACRASSPCAQDAVRQGPRPRPVLRRRHRRHPGRRARDHVRGGDRDRPLRRAGRAVRRPHRARAGRVRDARRGRLPARVGVLRVPPRAEAHRRPHVRAGHRRHALLDLRHRRVRRRHPRARASSPTRPRPR